MPRKPAVPPHLAHEFVIPCVIKATPELISMARQRNYVLVPEGTKLDVLDLYCDGCHRPYAEVRNKPCAAKIDNRHLRGGAVDGARRPRRNTRGRAVG